MKHLVALTLLALTACGPNINVQGMGTRLTQDQIAEQLVGTQVSFTAPATEGRYRATFTLQRNGSVTFRKPRPESGTWSFTEGTSDICIRFVVRFGGDPSCFGISALPDGTSYVTTHGYLMQRQPKQPVLVPPSAADVE